LSRIGEDVVDSIDQEFVEERGMGGTDDNSTRTH
jgi:hypothetical protein